MGKPTIGDWPYLSEVWETLCVEAEKYRINFWTWYDGVGETTDPSTLIRERAFSDAEGVHWYVGYLRGAADAFGITVRELLDAAGLDLRDQSEEDGT